MRLLDKFKCFIIIILIVFLSSCIEIEEKIIINDDKSGSYSISLDLGILSNNPISASKITNDITQFPQKIKKIIESTDGIYNIKTINENGKYAIGFAFRNHKAFKKALTKVAGLKYGFIIPNYIKIGNHRFAKKNITPLIKKQLENDKNNPLLQSYLGLDIPSAINIKSIVETPNNIKRVKKNATNIKTNNNIAEMNTTLRQILDGKNIEFVIKY